jgi:quinol monooxygenase YgiN
MTAVVFALSFPGRRAQSRRCQQEQIAMPDNNPTKHPRHPGGSFTRRSFAVLGASVALAEAASALPLKAQPRSRNFEGANVMSQTGMKQMNEIASGGLLVVAQWEAREGKEGAVVDTLRRFLPQAQSEPGVKLFLIGQARDNPAQFLFYELFDGEDAFVAHQASEYFKSLIVGEALPLLARRERKQYSLL